MKKPALLATAASMALTGGQLAQAAENDVRELAPTQVQGASESEAYQVERAQSSKYTAPLIDTPRSVTVIPQQVLKDTNALSLQDALRTVPGITMGAGEGGNPQGDRPFIRGFDAQSSTYLDGVRDTGAQSREIFAVESVEVSKGPNSAIGGRGSAGGSLNLVSKRAHKGNSLDGGFTWGSDQTQRYTLDGNYEFSETIAGRLNLMSHESNVAGRDKVNYDRWGIAPSLAFGLGTGTRLILDYYHMESDDLPDSGIPYTVAGRSKATPSEPTDGGDRGNFYGLTNRDFRETRADIGTLTFEHDLSDTLTVRNTLRHGNTMQDYILTQPDDSQGNVDLGTVWRRHNSRVGSTETTTNQTDLFGEFYLGGLKNSFSIGAEFSHEKADRSSYVVDTTSGVPRAGNQNRCTGVVGAASNYNCTSLANPTPDDPWAGSISRSPYGTETKSRTRALYLFDTLELDPQWLVNAGLRYDHFETDFTTTSATGTTRASDTSEFVTGQLGLVYKPAENGSVYVSYATSAIPPGSMLGEGTEENPLATGTTRSDMEPEETRNYEIGTKWDLLDDSLSLTAAIFRTEKDNARVLVADSTYENAGKTRVDGLELSATGKLTDKWQLFAGYSYLDSELVDGGALGNRSGVITNPVNPNNGNRLPNTPEQSVTLWTTYDVTGKLKIGGGAFYVDEVFGNVDNTTRVDSYVRYDAMASYEVNKNLDLQLNVQNLTDEVYYDKAYGTHFASQAAGRTVLLSTNVHF